MTARFRRKGCSPVPGAAVPPGTPPGAQHLLGSDLLNERAERRGRRAHVRGQIPGVRGQILGVRGQILGVANVRPSTARKGSRQALLRFPGPPREEGAHAMLISQGGRPRQGAVRKVEGWDERGRAVRSGPPSSRGGPLGAERAGRPCTPSASFP